MGLKGITVSSHQSAKIGSCALAAYVDYVFDLIFKEVTFLKTF